MHQDAAECGKAGQERALMLGAPPHGFWVATEVEDEKEEGNVGGSRGHHELGMPKRRCKMRRRKVASVRERVMPCDRR